MEENAIVQADWIESFKIQYDRKEKVYGVRAYTPDGMYYVYSSWPTLNEAKKALAELEHTLT